MNYNNKSLYKEIKEFKNTIEGMRGQVLSLDIKCTGCNNIIKNAIHIYPNDILDSKFNDVNFENEYEFQCKCGGWHPVRLHNISNIQSVGNLFDFIHIKDERIVGEIQEKTLWFNDKQYKHLLINPKKIKSTFSNASDIFFIPKDNPTLEHAQHIQNHMQSILGSNNICDYKMKKAGVQDFLNKNYREYIIPYFVDLNDINENGFIVDVNTYTVSLAKEHSRANYVSIAGNFETQDYFLDPNNIDKLVNSENYFNISQNVLIDTVVILYFANSIRPRRCSRILNAADPTLNGKWIVERLDLILSSYVFESIVTDMPNAKLNVLVTN